MPPKRSTAALTAASASCVLVTSSRATSRWSASPTASSTVPGLRPVATTLWPAASAALAMSTPIPRPAPVMSQVFFSVVMASSKARIRRRWESLLSEVLAGSPKRASPGLGWFRGDEAGDATNQLGRALFSELYAGPMRPANHARFVFLDPRAATFYADWDRAARETAAVLRSAAGRDPYDRDLSDLVGELATQSEEFRTHWAAHNVRFHATAIKHFHHPVVGELSLSFNRLDIAADHGLTLFAYAAEPGSRSEEALNLLGSWAATVDLAESARMTDQS